MPASPYEWTALDAAQMRISNRSPLYVDNDRYYYQSGLVIDTGPKQCGGEYRSKQVIECWQCKHDIV